MPGAGGPALPLDEMGFATLRPKMSRLEEDMRAYEAMLRQRGYTPTVWPVEGKLESGFGGRRNPFGGPGYEFHSGQDIEAAWGAPVVAGASGRSHLSAGKMVMASSSSSIMAAASQPATAIFRTSTWNSIRWYRGRNYWAR